MSATAFPETVPQRRLLAWAQATVTHFNVATVAAIIGRDGWELRLGDPAGRHGVLLLTSYLDNPPPRTVTELVDVLELHRARNCQ